MAESENKIVGCVGLKRLGDDDAELVRMSVSSSARGNGVGRQLFEVLLAFCKSHSILRIQA